MASSEHTRAGGVPPPGTDPELDEHVRDIEFLLRSVSFIVRQRGRQILSNFAITPPQFNALLELVRHGSLTMGELCARLYLASSTVTDLVDRMERAFLVVRERDSADRRVVRIKVLDKGHALVEAVMTARLNYLYGILHHIDAGERRQLIAALRHLHEVMIEPDVGG